jgi:hypothetical protein
LPGAKKKHHAFIWLAATIGCDVSQIDHERFAALWFSRTESQVRQAETMRQGAATAVNAPSSRQRGWFHFIHDSEDEADMRFEEYLAAREQ